MHKFLSFFFSVTLAMTMLPAAAFAVPDGGDSNTEAISSEDDIAGGICGSCSWRIDGNGELRIAPLYGNSGTLDDFIAITDAPWAPYANEITCVVVESRVYAERYFRGAFADCKNMTSADLSGLNTFDSKEIDSMFKNCSSLRTLDLTSLSTINVTNLSSMFEGCSSLEEIDLSSFSTEKTLYMTKMFKGCTKLRGLDISNFNASSLTSFWSMFEGCSALENLNLSKFHTSRVTSMMLLFDGCSSLKTLDISGLSTLHVDDMNYIFRGCSALQKVIISNEFEFKSPTTPQATTSLPAGNWRSQADGKVYSSAAIAANRSFVADTYTKMQSITSASLSQTEYTYDGTEKKPIVTVMSGSKTLEENVDYVLDFAGADLVGAGIKSIYIVGQGLYTSDKVGVIKYRINPAPITDISLDKKEFVYDGSEKKPSVTVRCGEKILQEGTEYSIQYPSNLASAGVKKITVTGKGNYSGTKSAEYEIVTTTITNVKLSQSVYTYDGDTKKPEIVVQSGSKTLVEGTDYAIQWPSDLVNAGTKKVAVTGVGKYSGMAEAEFSIKPASITSVSCEQNNVTYDGKQKRPHVAVKAGNATLIEGKDYTVSYPEDVINVGIKQVSVAGIGNYTGMRNISYEITPAPITSVEVLTPVMTWDHAMAPPSIVVKSGNYILAEDVDYIHNWYDINGGVGKRTLSVEATGRNYTGTKQYEVEIIAAPISAAYLDCESFYPDGTDIRPRVQYVDVEREGYTTSYANDGAMEYYDVVYPEHSSQPGIYYVTVKGKNNCTGTVTAKYEILPDSNSDVDPILPPDTPDTPDDSDIPNLPAPVSIQTMFRLYNPNSGEHFYTSSTVERDSIIAVGWQDEGAGWIAPTEGDPVYRLYNQYAGEHHYTTSAVERDMLVSVGWNDEGIGWYAGGERPLYRLYNPNAYANNHHYSTDVGERDILISIGWQDEGIAWYGVG